MNDTNAWLPKPDYVQITVDVWENSRNPYQMMYEATVDGSDQRRTYHTRWCTKQLVMDKTDEEFHAGWCTKQLVIDETNEELSIPEDVQNNRWCMIPNKEFIPDDVRNSCWWMRPTNGYSYQIMYRATVNGWERCGIHTRWCRNTCWWIRKMRDYSYQMVYKTTADGWER